MTDEIIEKVVLETKHYNNNGTLFSCDSEEVLYKLFPDGLGELTEDKAKEFSLYAGTHDYIDGEWTEKTKTDEELETLRQAAYSNVSTGSDRLFIEYQASLAQGSDDAEDKKSAWLARREEIKLEYPFNG